jgi:SsrA-binding protein
MNEKGLSLVPLRVYFVHGLAKVEVALARGKRKYEKRQSIAKREAQREMERAAGRRR